MGRGKRQAQGRAAPPVAESTPVVYRLPPWPRAGWANQDVGIVTSVWLRDPDHIEAALDVLKLEPSLGNAHALAIGAVVTGTDFDNAMGTTVYGEDSQEMTAYLTVNGKPTVEVNLANLCAWASQAYRGQKAPAIGERLLDARDLAVFADQQGLRDDWHEPDEIGLRVRGQRLDRSAEGIIIEFHQEEYVDGGIADLGLLAEARLVDLFAWARGWEQPEVEIKAGARLRRSPLAG
jgi:hypothetical protein